MAAAGRLKTRILASLCLPPLEHAVSAREKRCQSSVSRQQGPAKNSSQLIGQSWHVEKTCHEIIGTNHPGIGINSSSLEQNYSMTALGSASSLDRRAAVAVAHLTVRGKSLPRPRETELRI